MLMDIVVHGSWLSIAHGQGKRGASPHWLEVFKLRMSDYCDLLLGWLCAAFYAGRSVWHPLSCHALEPCGFVSELTLTWSMSLEPGATSVEPGALGHEP